MNKVDIIINNLLEYTYEKEERAEVIVHSLFYSLCGDWSADQQGTLAFEMKEHKEDSSLECVYPSDFSCVNLKLFEAEQLDILLRLILRNEEMPERVIEISKREKL